jgi:hypothetical protein
MFTDFATGQSVAPAPKASPPAPEAAAAPAAALGDGWIEWAGGECPILGAGYGQYALRFSDGEQIDKTNIAAHFHDWSAPGDGRVYWIVAYRLIPTEAA